MSTEFLMLNPLQSIWPVSHPYSLESPSFIYCQRLPLSFDRLSCSKSLNPFIFFLMPLNYFLRTVAHFSQYTHALALFFQKQKGDSRENEVPGVCNGRNPMMISSPSWRKYYSPALNGGGSLPFGVLLLLLILSRVIILQHLYLSG